MWGVYSFLLLRTFVSVLMEDLDEFINDHFRYIIVISVKKVTVT